MLLRRWSLVGLLCAFALSLSACGIAQAVLPSSATASHEYATHVVQAGETASQIAARYGMTIEQLIALNRDAYPELAYDPSLLRAGWRLRVTLTSSAPQKTLGLAGFDVDLVAQEVIDGVNAARARRGIGLLRSDVTLTRIAQDRSNDMIIRDYFSHYDQETGQEPFLRYLQAAQFSYRYAGENIYEIKNEAGWVPPWLTVAARYEPRELAKEFVQGWLNSPEHRANIYNARYRRTGVALAFSANGRRVVATQVFAD